jgi:hypothetical protein
MVDHMKGRSPPPIWAYAFRIVPPQSKTRLRAIGALLEQAHLAAHGESRTWAGRLILGAKTTRILIVSDSLARSRDVNRRLEAEFKRLKVDVSVTEPVALPGSGGLGRRHSARASQAPAHRRNQVKPPRSVRDTRRD